ncbi:SDR family oxidoreductase [Poriferisphaera corsica]|nr:NAD-dependent epimerase/dehydratase family protein [Poriferisphaera corsica]
MNDGQKELHAVTGAFGYSGGYIARRLLEQDKQVVTLTNRAGKGHDLEGRVDSRPLRFDRRDELIASLRGVKVLYNTYWVRFNSKRHGFSHERAVANTKVLFEAAKEAGVERIVHVSITNPSIDSRWSYFRGKAELENTLMNLGVSYAILRPAVLFGGRDILINNIAYVLRHFPVFGVFGDGQYRLQPIHVDDLAALAVEWGSKDKGGGDGVVDAIGPESFTYERLARELMGIIGVKKRVMHVKPWMGFVVGWLFGKYVGDVVITRDEIGGLMDDLLHVENKPTGKIKLTEWAEEYKDELGRAYQSELARR